MRTRPYLVVFALFLATIALSQNQVNSANAVEAATDKELTRLGLTSEKLERLKSIGLDLRTAWIRHEKDTELSQAATADAVVIGVVLRTEDVPAPRDYPFHSRVFVQVVESLKGSIEIGDTIRILRQSGPLIGEALELRFSDDISVRNGERAILFMQRPSRNSFLTSAYRQYFADGKAKIDDSEYWVDFYAFHKINGGRVDFLGDRKDINEVVRNVRKIAKVLQ